MVPKKRNRRHIGHPGKPTSAILAPNDLWSADFKGQFKTGDGRYCYPLTVTDGFSRYLLGCQGLHSTSVAEAKPLFTRCSKNMACPNGFAPTTACPLPLTPWRGSRAFGMVGALRRDARAHRTWKAATEWATRAHASHAQSRNHTTRRGEPRAQQRKFNHFREEFNHERPHEALDHANASLVLSRFLAPDAQQTSSHSNIPIASRCATSAPTAACAGIAIGSTSQPSAQANTSALRKSMTASGTSTSARLSSGAFTKGTCASRMNMADLNATMCNPCPRTLLLPISPTAQLPRPSQALVTWATLPAAAVCPTLRRRPLSPTGRKIQPH